MLFNRQLSFLLAPLLLVSIALAGGDVWIVDAGGAGDFTEVQAAIDAAAQQDTILIQPGNYSGFHVDNKALTLAVDGVETPRIEGGVTISNLGPGRPVSLAGLNLRAGFNIALCQGEVRLSDCICLATGLVYTDLSVSHRVFDSDMVIFSRCTLVGRDGGQVDAGCDTADGIDGENGLDVYGSRVALYSTLVEGGRGGDSYDGGCIFCLPAFASDGGDGVRGNDSSELYLDDSAAIGGLQGIEGDWCDPWFYDGIDGQPATLLDGSTLTQAADPVLRLGSPTVVREDDPLMLTIEGPAGATGMLIWSEIPDWRFFGTSLGVLHMSSASLHIVPLGTIPGSGSLTTSITPPQVAAGKDARRLYIQAFAISGASGRLLGTPASLDVLDSSL